LSYEGEFYDIAKIINRPFIKNGASEEKKILLYSSTIQLHNESVKFNRQIYNIFDLLGDLGGVTEVIMIVFGFFLFSISEHSFYLTAFSELFYARTVDEKMFTGLKTNKYLNKDLIPSDTTH
jgi:hypothetical protein